MYKSEGNNPTETWEGISDLTAVPKQEVTDVCYGNSHIHNIKATRESQTPNYCSDY